MAVIRKQRGHFLEDFVPGDALPPQGREDRHRRAVRALHRLLDDHEPAREERALRAARTASSGLVVPPGLVMAVVFSQSVEDVSENARANLEYIDMRFGAPVYVGDTLEAETRVLGVKGSSSNPMLGVVHVQTTGRNQAGEVVLTFQRKVQVWKRDPRGGATRRRSRAGAHRDVARPARLRSRRGLRSARAPHQRRHVFRGLHAPATSSSTRAAAWSRPITSC